MTVNALKPRRWRGDALALAAGALVPLSLAPFALWPLGLLAAALLAHLLDGLCGRQALRRAFAFGTGMFGAGASWVYVAIHDFAYTPVLLAAVMTAFFVLGLALVFALPFALYGRFFSPSPLGRTLGFSALWTLGEWLRSWLLTGFPWLYLGYAHVDTWLGGWAPLLGVFGLSFITVLTATTAWQAVRLCYRRQLAWPQAAGISAVLLSLWLAGASLAQRPLPGIDQAPGLSAAIVQPNIPLEVKWNPLYLDEILQVLRDETAPYWGHDLIVWPEAAIPVMFHEAEFFFDELRERAQQSHSGLITGILYDDAQPMIFYNSIAGLGRADGVYFKQRLVPFGEYVPLERYLRGLIEFFDLPNSIIYPGPSGQDILRFDDVRVAPSICYEIVYPDLVASLARDAQLMITISNDAWFGASIGPMQHFQMAQMRAMENERFLIRATNTGISGFIDPRGRALVTSEQYARDSISTQAIKLLGHQTFFARWGSTPILALCFMLLFAKALRQVRRRQRQLTHIPG